MTKENKWIVEINGKIFTEYGARRFAVIARSIGKYARKYRSVDCFKILIHKAEGKHHQKQLPRYGFG